ncbi:Glycosyltransferase involved in cell wall biosynthesis [Candidatus Fervidibacteria bacterium JGI MDM2 SSWTFF-3-K9]
MQKIATITHLFPNPSQPILGIFVKHRIKAMANYLYVEVIAPVGWLPAGLSGRPRSVPRMRQDERILVHHPRFLSPPILKPLESFFFLQGVMPTFIHRHLSLQFNVLDTHFAYPDAPAVWLLASIVRRPFVVTVRGEDVYGHPRFPLRKLQIVQALKYASRVICLSDVTYKCCIELGVQSSKIIKIPNGVDGQVFKLIDRQIARKILGIDNNIVLLLSSGWIIPRKGYHYVIQALPYLQKIYPNIRYVIIGGDTTTGEYKKFIITLAEELGVRHLISFVDILPQDQLALWMNAADIFCLPSEKEGWGNVVLEALSCGTPVVAHNVGGVKQMIINGLNGFVLEDKSPTAWFEALNECLKHQWNRNTIRSSVSHWQWDKVGKQIAELMEQVWNEFKHG